MTWIDVLGYAASASVLVTFCMGTMVPLRIVAICSNVLFASYGAIAHIYPVLVLHLVLLPVNVTRLVQIQRLVRDVRAAARGELAIETLLPLMSRRIFNAGDVLVRAGETADHMYYLAKGTMRIPELGKVIEPGALVGEIGTFARDRRRTATVVCASECEVYEISASAATQLYYQDRSFGLAMIQLIISRLLENAKAVGAGTGAGAAPAGGAVPHEAGAPPA